jgi:hypothetical protein
MDDTLRAAVATRAARCCEYCRVHEADDAYRFHVEHIIAIKHGGTDEPANLAYACQHCNLRKGPNLSGIDPESGSIVTLFHPRRDTWSEHFMQVEYRLIGRTPAGRATVQVLAMNDADRVQLRAMLGG